MTFQAWHRVRIHGNVTQWSGVTDAGYPVALRVVMVPANGGTFYMSSNERIRYGHGVGPGGNVRTLGEYPHRLELEPLNTWRGDERETVEAWVRGELEVDEFLVGYGWREYQAPARDTDPAQFSLLTGASG